jgi:hypothetical protein
VKASEHTQAIDQRVNLGTQSATRAPDRMVAFFFGRAGSMLVGTHNRTVDENLLKVGVTRQLGEYRMPYLHDPDVASDAQGVGLVDRAE